MGKDLRLALGKNVLSEKIKISSTSPELDLNSWENRPEMLKIGEKRHSSATEEAGGCNWDKYQDGLGAQSLFHALTR